MRSHAHKGSSLLILSKINQMKYSLILFLCLPSLFIISSSSSSSSSGSIQESDDDLHTYIVHVDPMARDSFTPSRLVYSYKVAISGFAARLTEAELEELKLRPGFLQASPDRLLDLHTTYTPNFLGLGYIRRFWTEPADYGRGVIIGVLDTGIDPDHSSFSPPQGLILPPPAKWKGHCEFNGQGTCNNKLVGARSFLRGLDAMYGQTSSSSSSNSASARDFVGHGTHCAGIAAGLFVKNVSINGLAAGTASGVAPYAHVASYKVCNSSAGCAESDVVAGLEAAIEDGVDILSISLGSSRSTFYDNLAIATLAAVEKGIFVAASAGNEGPGISTLRSEAPWVLTVGASTTDRRLESVVQLPDGTKIIGQSAYQPSDHVPRPLPLVYAGSIDQSAATCRPYTLRSIAARGKIVVCDADDRNAADKGREVRRVGGAGMIIANAKITAYTVRSEAFDLPASHVSYSDGAYIKSYIETSADPQAAIVFRGTTQEKEIGPRITSFSSRGPSRADPRILKPDMVGPGLNILAAVPGNTFEMKSGTSMATAHLAGEAALLKKAHPDWSVAVIKSAIMEEATTWDNHGNDIQDQELERASVYAMGAGQANPINSHGSDLAYELSPNDYVPYLCGLYTDKQVSTILRRSTKCSDYTSISGSQLNYPSIGVSLISDPLTVRQVTIKRTLTNIRKPNTEQYLAFEFLSNSDALTQVLIEPQELSFSSINQTLEFSITFTCKSNRVGTSEGRLKWSPDSDMERFASIPVMIEVIAGAKANGAAAESM